MSTLGTTEPRPLHEIPIVELMDEVVRRCDTVVFFAMQYDTRHRSFRERYRMKGPTASGLGAVEYLRHMIASEIAADEVVRRLDFEGGDDFSEVTP